MRRNCMSTSHKHQIIGIGGLPRSGKDSLAQYFMDNGYFGVSLGDIVRDHARVRHSDKPDPISVENMTETSNWLRSERGADFALKIAQERFRVAVKANETLKGLVVFSVRAPAEVDYILQHDGELVWVEASDRTRYERAMEHLREGESAVSLDEFKRQEALQWQPQPDIPEVVQMSTAYVKAKATQIFTNELSLEEFKKKAKTFVERFKVDS